MKKSLVSLATVLASLFLFNSFLQAQVQQHVWYLPEQQARFTSATPVVSTPPFSPSSYMESNGVHDAAGNMILKVVDGVVYNRYNNTIGYLQNYGNRGYTPELAIIPVKGELCSYYIVYSDYTLPMLCCVNGTEPCCFTGTDLRYSKVDLAANSGQGAFVSNGNVLSATTGGSWEGFAVSRADGSGNRRIFHIRMENPLIVKKYLVTGTGIAYENQFSVSLGSGVYPGLSAGETELSHDGTKLAISDRYDGKIYMVHLNAATGALNTSLGTGGVTTFSMPSGGSANGIEFTPDNSRLFVSDNYGTGIRYITLSSGVVSAPVTGSANWGSSFLELAYDAGTGYRIGVLQGDKLGLVTSLSGTPGFTNTGLTLYGGDDWYSGMKRLPKQIDGEDYIARFSGSTGTAACCAFNSGIDVLSYNVTSTQTWSGTNPINSGTVLTVGQELRVKTGAYLTLTNLTVRFLDQARVVVEPGARLTLNNTTLTSVNCGTMWKGVEVQGNFSVAQTAANQGYLYANAGSVISNAMDGVRLCGTLSGGGIDWAKTGGVVRGTGATFRNNKRDVEFLGYSFANTSSFSDCTFIIDAALNNGQVPYARVSMNGVDGVSFSGCDFKNTTTGLYAANQRGYGIHSIDAKFRVSFRCPVLVPFGTPCPSRDRCKFDGFVYGINSSASSTAYTTDVRYSDFINNQYDVYLSGLSMPVAVENNFTVANPVPYGGFIPVSAGLYLDQCTGYQVENNVFTYTGPAGVGFVFGAWVNNSNNGGAAPDVNRIYNNTFNGLIAAAVSTGTNVQLSGGNAVSNTGLTFKCNKFNGTTAVDLYIAGQVSPFQGTCLVAPAGSPHSPANNLFSVPASPTDIGNTMGTSFQLDYRYSPSTTFQTAPRSGLYDITNTTVTACTSLPDYSAASCPVTVFDGARIREVDLRAENSNEQLAGDKQKRLDAGAKEHLLPLVYATDGAQLENALKPYAPYLADEVLLAVIQRAPVLPAGTVVSILKANAPLSKAVLLGVEESALNDSQKKELRAEAGISPVQDLLSQIAYHHHEAALAANEAARQAIFEEGADMRDMELPGKEITPGDLELSGIMNRLAQKPEGVFALQTDEGLRAEVENLAARRDGSREAVRAAMILQFVFGTPYLPEVPELPLKKNAEDAKGPEAIVTATQADVLNIYPNPAQDLIYIASGLKAMERASVKIYSVSGALLLDTYISGDKAQVNVETLKSGVYMLRLTMPDGSVKTNRMVIQK
ncbi:MAG: T9SS type A sorting domain-containing protein [Flavobacteriales bacterium]